APLAPYDAPMLSPDGSRVASTLFGATDAVVVYDFGARSSTRVAAEGNCSLVSWHPDGQRVLLSSDAEGSGKLTLFLADARGAGKPRRLGADVATVDARLLARLSDGI